MKKNLKLILIIVVIALVFLTSGIFVGKYVFEKNNIDYTNNDKTNINTDNVDKNTEDIRYVTLGKYLYYLAEAMYFNCSHTYFDTTTENNVLLINNYDELKNSFTNEFIKNTEFLPPLFSDCYVKMDNGKVDVSNCWCGMGSPNGVYTKLVDFTVISSDDNEIIYEVFITEFDFYTNQEINTYKDSFTIKRVDGDWKIDKYVYRYIS